MQLLKLKKSLKDSFPGYLKYKHGVKAVYEKILWPLRYMPGKSTVFGPPRGSYPDTLAYNNCNPATPIEERIIKEASTLTKTLPFSNSGIVLNYFENRIQTAFVEKKSWVFKKARYICKDGTIVTSDDKIFLPTSPLRYWRFNKDHQSFYHIKLPKMKVLKKVILMDTPKADGNYCHWLRDHLTRFFWLKQLNIDFSEYTLVASHGEAVYCQHTEELLVDHGFNFKEWLFIKNFEHFYADEIVLPPFTNFELRNGVLNEAEIYFLREILLKSGSANVSAYDKIYLSRRKARRSSPAEPELVDRLADCGIKEIFLEDLNIFEQVALFSKATLIIGLHGTAFINLVFCKKDVTVIEIFGPDYVVSAYWSIADLLSLNYYTYCDDEYIGAYENTAPHLTPVLINVDNFFNYFRELNIFQKI